MRYVHLCLAAIATALLAPVEAALAQAFPGKVVRLIIPFPTGSSTDAEARIIGPQLSERWKQPVIVDSRPGATTIIGTELVAKSPPDGHTLLFTSIQFSYLPALFAKLPYDPYNDLMPVTIVAFSPEAIVSHPSLPVRNVKELVALARTRQLNIGTPGNELTTRYFNMMAKVNLVPISYKGGAPLMVDVIGGHVELGIAGTITLQGIIRSGRVRLLGIASSKPSLIFPDAPLIPKDVPGFEIISWWGIFAPRNTPREVVGRIRDDIAAVLRMPDVRTRLLDIGGEPGGATVEEFTATVRSQIAHWQKVATAAGIKPQ
ncbi:MAG: tripartite tricarboxylate transporter substrate binding protein [Burkholderiales bacterium]|nr:tripartite tricarboxylate transporter substrate binding protein [Burkholderiales bacterium]